MSAPPLVSAIIPAHNGERYLGEAIRSVLAQDYHPLELVVVDDGSTDGSARVASGFPGVRLLRQENRGVADARNAGVRASRGAILAFLDQDDLWCPSKLRAQVRRLLGDPGLGFSLGHQRLFLEGGTPEPPWLRVSELDRPHVAYFPGALVVRREAFERVGGFRADAVPGEGADWFLRAQELAIPKAIVPEVVLLKRIHHTNQSGDMSEARQQVLRALGRSLQRRRREQSQ